jgi:hypothetical protein
LIRRVVNVLFVIMSVVSFLVCLFNQSSVPEGYEYIALLPLIYLFGFIFFFVPVIKKKKYIITVYSYILLSFIRMVLIPFFGVVSGYYREADYGTFIAESLQLSVWLMIYEYILSTLFLVLVISIAQYKGSNFNSIKSSIHLGGNKIVYITFMFLGILVYFIWGRPEGLVKFVALSSEVGERYGDQSSSLINLATQVIKIALVCAFLITISVCIKLHQKSMKNIYVNISILVAMLNVSLIVGERRTMILFTGIATILVLIRAFPLHKRRVLNVVGGTAFIILLIMTIYKSFYAGRHDSYSEAIQSASLSLDYFSQSLQAYFVGPHNISWTIDLKNIYGSNISSLVFDFLRSTFGLSFLLKDIGTLTSAKFNTFIYGTFTPSGHIISSIGYGYYYLGIVLSPFFTCIHILLSKALESRLYKSTSFEGLFLWSYLLSRLISTMFFNTPSIITFLTTTLATMGLVFVFARLLNTRKIFRF